MSGDKDFLSRWSRRKREGGEAVPEPAPPPEPTVEVPDERTDEEILAGLGLKHPDALEPGDDIRGFMQAAVPDRLRRLALRQLWRTKPELAVLDGLVDYGEDYTDAAMVVANLQTAYRVGKGMLRDEPEAPAEAERVVETVEETAATTPGEAEPQEGIEGEPEPDEADPTADNAEDPNEDEGLADGPTRRRMAFRFDGD